MLRIERENAVAFLRQHMDIVSTRDYHITQSLVDQHREKGRLTERQWGVIMTVTNGTLLNAVPAPFTGPDGLSEAENAEAFAEAAAVLGNPERIFTDWEEAIDAASSAVAEYYIRKTEDPVWVKKHAREKAKREREAKKALRDRRDGRTPAPAPTPVPAPAAVCGVERATVAAAAPSPVSRSLDTLPESIRGTFTRPTPGSDARRLAFTA